MAVRHLALGLLGQRVTPCSAVWQPQAGFPEYCADIPPAGHEGSGFSTTSLSELTFPAVILSGVKRSSVALLTSEDTGLFRETRWPALESLPSS